MEKIKRSDGVYIVIPDNCLTVLDIGSSTLKELEASIKLHKMVLFSSMFPDLLYLLQTISEVDPIDPIVIGDILGPNIKLFIFRYKIESMEVE